MISTPHSESKIRLTYGPHDLRVEAFDLTVGEQLLAYRDILNALDSLEAYLNGRLVNFDALTLPSDRLEFIKPYGEKGGITYDIPRGRPYRLITGDALDVLRRLPAECVNCCVTSPPYFGGVRDYGIDGQLGQEETVNAYVRNLVNVFRQLRRVLTKDGTLWLVIGDKYSDSIKQSGLRPGNLIGVPGRVASALQDDGWVLRRDIIWHKPNAMPYGKVKAPGVEHEYVYMLSKSYPHYYGLDDLRVPYKSPPRRRLRGDCFGKAIRLGNGWHGKGSPYIEQHPDGRNIRTMWSIPTAKDSAHPAPFPVELARRCVLLGCPKNGVVMDCFSGHATTGVAALKNSRSYLGIELNPQYNQAAKKRLDAVLRG